MRPIDADELKRYIVEKLGDPDSGKPSIFKEAAMLFLTMIDNQPTVKTIVTQNSDGSLPIVHADHFFPSEELFAKEMERRHNYLKENYLCFSCENFNEKSLYCFGWHGYCGFMRRCVRFKEKNEQGE